MISDDGLRQCRGHFVGDTLDVVLQYLVCRLRHGPVVVALHLIERHILMTHELQHAPEVGLLLIAPIEFQLPVAGDDDDGRCVGTDVGERGITVDGGLQGRYALLLANVVVGKTIVILKRWYKYRYKLGKRTTFA